MIELPEAGRHGVYGLPPSDLAELPAGAIQFSPLSPGAARLEDESGTLDSLTMLAPPGTLERRHELALALKALKPGGRLTAMAPKDKGGSRLGKELAAFGAAPSEHSQRHHRIVTALRPDAATGLDAAIAGGAPQLFEEAQFWSQPGIFSWDRLDPGTALLLANFPALQGRGADFGCGVGVLSRAALASPAVTALAAIDIDRRAIEMATRNLPDPRVALHWQDVRRVELRDLDFVVSNPPFHEAGAEDRGLGQAFLRAARQALRKGGKAYVTANRHLPYEAVLDEAFARWKVIADEGGYKVIEAQA